MKAYNKWGFLLLMAVTVFACKSSSEDELIGNWKKRGDFGGSPRAYATAFVIGNKGYVCCGFNGGKEARRDMVEYDNALGSWTRMEHDSLPKGAQRRNAVAFTIGDKAYLGTGWDNDNKIMRDFYEFDPNRAPGDRWHPIAPLPAAAPARYDAVAFSLGGYGYVGLGYTAGTDKEALQDFWRYDPSTGEWTIVGGYGGSKRYAATAFVIGDKAYICTGINAGGALGASSISDMWSFDGTAWNSYNYTGSGPRDIWTTNKDEDYDDKYTTIMRSSAVSFVMDGKGYVTAGNLNNTWEYDPLVDLWTERTSFSSYIRNAAVAFSFPADVTLKGAQGFVMTGSSGNAYLEDMREFFPFVENDEFDD